MATAPSVWGLVTNARSAMEAAVLVQQLVDMRTKLPIVVFNTTEMPDASAATFEALGAQLVSLEPAMPVYDGLMPGIRRSVGKLPAWYKLGLWAQTRYARIVYLDLDVVLLRNVDEMGEFPGDTYSPEVCTYPCSKQVGGVNVGVMVLAPNLDRFLSFQRFAASWSERLLTLTAAGANESIAGTNESIAQRARTDKLMIKIVGSSEQSFLREWNEHALGARVTSFAPERRGMDWTHRSFKTQRCYNSDAKGSTEAPGRALSAAFSGSYRRGRAGSSGDGGSGRADGGGVGPGKRGGAPATKPPPPPQKTCLDATVNVMSRVYNARPADCDRCSATEAASVAVVHYACAIKPWGKSRAGWVRAGEGKCRENPGPVCSPCIVAWTLRWFDAQKRMCGRLRAATGAAPLRGCAETLTWNATR